MTVSIFPSVSVCAEATIGAAPTITAVVASKINLDLFRVRI
jgi:hypothetical protein